MSLAGWFPGPMGRATTCSQFIESSLSNQSSSSSYEYYWSEPGLIIGLCELMAPDSLGQGQVEPSTLFIIRGPFGRHVWHMNFQLTPKSSSQFSTKFDEIQLDRPKPWGCFLERLLNTIRINASNIPLNFPQTIDEIPLVKA